VGSLCASSRLVPIAELDIPELLVKRGVRLTSSPGRWITVGASFHEELQDVCAYVLLLLDESGVRSKFFC